MTSATDDTPVITIENTSDGIGGGALNFKRTTTDEAANDIIGSVNFMAKDAAGNEHIYAAIQGLIDDPTSGGEEGRLIFKVAEFDGNQQEGLRIEGQASNGIVDVRVSNGSLQLKDLGAAGCMSMAITFILLMTVVHRHNLTVRQVDQPPTILLQ